MGNNKGTAVAPARSLVNDAVEENDIVTVEPDDTFEKAVSSSSAEFRSTFHGRAKSHVGVSWKADFAKKKRQTRRRA